MAAYYNEIDADAAGLLVEMMADGLIPFGDVDTRSIEDVCPEDLRPYRHCHFFAGCGGWAIALAAAGWPDDVPAWTGSCPCQSFSAAGKGKGFADERHLWPAFFHLIESGRPPYLFGEQVASKDALAWLDLVQADLEGAGYACRALDLCAAGFGAPHIRQRLYWMADAVGEPRGPEYVHQSRGRKAAGPYDGPIAGSGGGAGRMDHALRDGSRPGQRNEVCPGWQSALVSGGARRLGDSEGLGREAGVCLPIGDVEGLAGPEMSGDLGGLAHTPGAGSLPGSQAGVHRGEEGAGSRDGESERCGAVDGPGPTNGHWRDSDWLFCRDNKWRPIMPESFPLAPRATTSVAKRVRKVGLQVAGNCLCVPQATEVVRAYMEAAEVALVA